MLKNRIERAFNYHLKERLPAAALGILRANSVTAYWYRETLNFGDVLTPILLRHHGFTPIHAYPRRASVASTGSILEHLPETFNGVILGSGFINAESSCSFPEARILSVRGTLTRDRIRGIAPEVTLGDPGLYAAKLMGRRRDSVYSIGIVPHHSNLKAQPLKTIAIRSPGDVRIISPVAQPVDVFSKISECEIIISASLHGLIIADALGIPSVWIAEPAVLGGTFKFYDYASAVGRNNWAPSTLNGCESLAELNSLTSCAPADAVAECQDGLAKAFEEFARLQRLRL